MLHDSPISSRNAAEKIYTGMVTNHTIIGTKIAMERRLYEIISVFSNLTITEKSHKGYNPTITWKGIDGLNEMLRMVNEG